MEEMEENDLEERKRRFVQALIRMEEIEREHERQNREALSRIKAAKETPALTAKAAADYYHDLTAAQDMLENDGR